MALQNDTSRIQYNGNNSTTNSYAIPFVFFENAHIKCVVTTSAGVDTELTLGSGFNVTGAGNANGGSLTTVTAVPTTSKVTIYRSVPVTQTTSYQEGGDFPAASHEKALDKLTMIAQQTKRLADRALKVPESQNNPSDIPNAGSGQKLLGINNGTLTWEENRQIPAYPTGPQQKLLAAPGGGNPPTWNDGPTIAVGPITATNTITPRFIADRFAQDVNVKDFGAVGNGVADDTLAIYRALLFATGFPENANVDISTIGLTTTHPNAPGPGGLSLPIGYVQQGRRRVIFPVGVYRTTEPLPINHGFQLIGDGGPDKCLIMPDYTTKAFNVFEDSSAYKNRVYPYQGLVPNGGAPDGQNNIYQAHITMENLQIHPGTTAGLDSVIKRRNDITWYAISMITGEWLYPTGTAGTNIVTYTGINTPLPYGTQIKFGNHATVYTVVNSGTNSWTLNTTLTSNVASNHSVLLGITGTNGIFLAGGQECSTFKRLLIGKFSGAGIHVYWGSPAPTIENCMVNECVVAYWLDTGPATLNQPSGDQNEILFRIAWYVGHGGVYNIIGTKEETFADAMQDRAGLTFKKTTIQAGAYGPIPTSINVIGGTFNAPPQHGSPLRPDLSDYVDRGWMEVHRNGSAPIVNLIGGYNSHAWGDYIIKMFDRNTGAFEELFSVRRNGGFNESRLSYGPTAALYLSQAAVSNTLSANYGSANAVLQARPGTLNCGIQMDNNGGHFYRSVPWTRSGTTLTFTVSNHKVKKSDYVRVSGLSGVTPQNTHPSGSGSILCTAITSNTFSIEVSNSGSTNGTASSIQLQSLVAFHAIDQGTHILQCPTNTGSGTRILDIIDVDSNSLAGVKAPITNVGLLWAKSGFIMGNSMASPSIEMYFVPSGTPSDTNKPDGSIALKKDGAPDNLLFVKSNNAYYPLLSRNTFQTGTSAPTNTPEFVGQHFINTSNQKVYIATGTTDSTNWTAIN